MIDQSRPSLPVPPSAAALLPALRPAAGAIPRPVEPVPGPRGLAAWQGSQRPLTGEDAAEAVEPPARAGRRVGPDDLAGDEAAGRGHSRAGHLAFLAQQIHQEAMQTGLHLEPWARGIGAYLRAGAEPRGESAAPAAIRLSV